MKFRFEWNPEKAKINLKKHGVDFEEASTIFDDPQYISFLDEDRIRIISARKAAKNEEKFYNEAG